MTWLRVFLSRLEGVFLRRRSEQQLTEEIEAHLAFLEEEHLRHGMSAEEARAAARRDFGGVEQIKELYRDQRGLPFVDALRQDFGFALRLLLKDRWVSGAIIIAMGLGLAANTAMFSLVDSLLVKKLPVHDPDQLVQIQVDQESGRNYWATYPAWEEIRDRELFESALAWSEEHLALMNAGETYSADGIWVSQGFFDVLGVAPMIGRLSTRQGRGRCPKPACPSPC